MSPSMGDLWNGIMALPAAVRARHTSPVSPRGPLYEIVADVSRALSRAGLPAQALVLEITESEDLPSDEALAATVGELRRQLVAVDGEAVECAA